MHQAIIVDDKKTIREGLKRYVKWNEAGFEVSDVFDSARKAIDYIEIESVDLILTDIVMPEMDGLAMIKEIKLINPEIKIIIMSAYEKFEYAQQAVRLGAIDYFTKPVDLDALLEELLRLSTILDEELSARQARLEYQRMLDLSQFSEPAEGSVGLIVEKTKEYIDSHYAEEITLARIADLVYVNPGYLSRLFKEQTGVNFIDYLTNTRVRNAKYLLRDMSLRIYDISSLVGYKSHKHFSKVFKDETGYSPKDYRNKVITRE